MRARSLAVLAVLTLLGAAAPVVAATGSSAPMVGQDQARLRAGTGGPLLLNFDNGESLAADTIVRNVAGRGGGRVLVAAGGQLVSERGAFKRGAGFPCRNTNCGRAIIEVQDKPALDPMRRPLKFGATVRLTPAQGRGHSNVIQKGYFKQRGGQYKLQIDFGTPSCVLSGRHGRIIAQSDVRVTDRAWHRIVCSRTPTAVKLFVDGVSRARVEGHVGHISSDAPVKVGGKRVITGPNQQYHGSLDDVFVTMRPAAK